MTQFSFFFQVSLQSSVLSSLQSWCTCSPENYQHSSSTSYRYAEERCCYVIHTYRTVVPSQRHFALSFTSHIRKNICFVVAVTLQIQIVLWVQFPTGQLEISPQFIIQFHCFSHFVVLTYQDIQNIQYALASETIPVPARSIRRESAIARLLELRVQIPPVHGYLFLLSVAYCQVEVSASGRSRFQREVLTNMVCLSVVIKPWPSRDFYHIDKIVSSSTFI